MGARLFWSAKGDNRRVSFYRLKNGLYLLRTTRLHNSFIDHRSFSYTRKFFDKIYTIADLTMTPETAELMVDGFKQWIERGSK